MSYQDSWYSLLIQGWMPYVAVGISLAFIIVQLQFTPTATTTDPLPGAFAGSSKKKKRKGKPVNTLSKNRTNSPTKTPDHSTTVLSSVADSNALQSSSQEALPATQKSASPKRKILEKGTKICLDFKLRSEQNDATAKQESHAQENTSWVVQSNQFGKKRKQAIPQSASLLTQEWPTPAATCPSSSSNTKSKQRKNTPISNPSLNLSSSTVGSDSVDFSKDPIDGSMRTDADDDVEVRARVLKVLPPEEISIESPMPAEDGWQPKPTSSTIGSSTLGTPVLTKTQRKNMRKNDLAKAAKDESDRLQRERLNQHRRAQETEQLNALAAKSRDAARQRAMDRNY
ncbi:hypothetical protein BATDEDRAFT_88035 [Batrachochytrium dendrobatidis JAM81]|uniref:Uncharacterized protein n=1 Tax=Batrachochytrium dendrobatidis (strain JAM81 / FGSC 10211) TaxID=684364 RepID=F4P1A0_BATDJ|nr:uncharacterized protein BATDEDRAFT_88035 [Batrachochytrium dendrobatidis JAM81]EGF80709.1 hypothetical protein BATDEDRAFT_88035 [Batrachochytrium dendrobatidis JAM81]|eukprot:XP_006678662.1 hypothetical protein BATDEDRAFT_88035 [Batrachochytrium dendrobatidis JAM81]